MLQVPRTKTGGIYKIVNTVTGSCYIGSSANLYKRLSEHLRVLRLNEHYNAYLQRSWNKYGEESFIAEVLELCSEGKLLEREQFYIDSISPEFNICKVAGSPRGVKHGDDKVRQNSERVKLWWEDSGNRERIILAQNAAKNNPEVVEIYRQAALKYNSENPEKGSNHSAIMRNLFSDPDFYDKFCTRMSEVKNNPDYKNKISKSVKELWKDPNYRLKNSKVTDDQAIEILRLKRDTRLTHKEIAEVIGCVKSVVDNISAGNTYRHIDRETLEIDPEYL